MIKASCMKFYVLVVEGEAEINCIRRFIGLPSISVPLFVQLKAHELFLVGLCKVH